MVDMPPRALQQQQQQQAGVQDMGCGWGQPRALQQRQASRARAVGEGGAEALLCRTLQLHEAQKARAVGGGSSMLPRTLQQLQAGLQDERCG